MKKLHGDVVLVTGASSGIGKAIAENLAGRGYRVYGTTRKQIDDIKNRALSDISKKEGFLEMINLDVCIEESAKKAIEYIKAKEGKLDILINNAGFGIAGAVEDTTVEEAKSQFETNFFGVHRMIRHVMPVMRTQKRGMIINISSVGSLITIPYQSMYCASKRAVEALTEALRIEAKQFGVTAVLVEPGDTKTGFTDRRKFIAALESSVYAENCKKAVSTMENDEINGENPEAVAHVILSILKKRKPPVRKTVGFKYKVFVLLKRIIPPHFEEFIISRIY
jgi:short-subunit dehydrogenase